MLFEVDLDKIEKIMLRKEAHFKKEREELYLQFDCGEIARIHISGIRRIREGNKNSSWTRSRK